MANPKFNLRDFLESQKQFAQKSQLGELEDSEGLSLPRYDDTRLQTFDQSEMQNQSPLVEDDIDMSDEALMYEVPAPIKGLPISGEQGAIKQLSSANIVDRRPISGIPSSNRIRTEEFDQREINKQAPLAEEVEATDEELMKESVKKPMSLQDMLLDAQGRAENTSNLGMIAKASRGFLNAGLERAGGKAMEAETAQDIMKSADRPVQDLQRQIEAKKTSMEFEKNEIARQREKDLKDPKSQASKELQEFARSVGINVKDNTPGSLITDRLELLLKVKEAAEDRKLKQRELDIKEREITKGPARELAKEQAKEQREISKEDRKIRRDLDAAETSLESKIKQLKDVKEKFEAAGKGISLGTGPVATLGGLSKYVSEKDQMLDTKFNQIGLDEMVKMFAGMSKAVDSNAERAKFESTQPALTLDDDVNKELFETKIQAAEDLLIKTREAKKRYDENGTFDPAVTRQTTNNNQENVSKKTPTTISRPPVVQNGHTYNWNEKTGKYE